MQMVEYAKGLTVNDGLIAERAADDNIARKEENAGDVLSSLLFLLLIDF